MNEETKTLIKKTVEELLEKMGFPSEVRVTSDQGDEDSLICDVTTQTDSNFLIGQHGINLQAVQHLARLMVRKGTDEKIRFVLDVNSYRQQKNQSVVELAHQTAQQAVSERRAIIMKPMSTYERRIVHMELSKNDDVVTESIGEGESRKIVVKPANALQ
jgi:spoIIIJ-associated protein